MNEEAKDLYLDIKMTLAVHGRLIELIGPFPMPEPLYSTVTQALMKGYLWVYDRNEEEHYFIETQ